MIVAAAPTAVIIFGQNVSLVEGELPRTPPASLKLDSDLPGSPDPGWLCRQCGRTCASSRGSRRRLGARS